MTKSVGRLLLMVCTGLLAVILLAGCGEGQRNNGSSAGAPDIYTIADTTGDWGFPSPYGHHPRGPGILRMSMIFDTLVWKDAAGFVPALAEDWSYDEAGLTYTFNLRRDVTWHDGQPFTAGDVVFTFDYVGKYPYSMVDTTMVAQVEAIDDYTVQVKLHEPYAPFLEYTAGTLPILPKHIWENVDNPETYRESDALVGTGPFKLVDYNKEHGTYLYAANENYYGGRPLVRQIRYVKVSQEMAHSALQKGEVNAAEVPPEVVEGLQKDGITVTSGPHFWNTKLMINHTMEPFSHKEFRQALAYAIDREELARVVGRGHAVAASPGMLPPDSDWHNPDVQQYRHDPVKAAALLKGLGYTQQDGYFQKDGRPLVLEMLVSQEYTRDGEIIAAQLDKAGIKVELRSLEAKTLDSRVQQWDFELAFSGHGGLGSDPVVLNNMILGKSFNSARYAASMKLNGLLAAQLKETDPAARKQLVQEAQAVYAGELPALSLYYPTWYWGHDGSIDLYYTKGGVASGVPQPLNKLCFVESN
ncbi:ABC transporter substrate-binding protein [Desulfallas thermosapovorans]|uniref:Peptide/nickel transport system substrate-binding protein n=1 Tax=Desulfallas thermosapovorans DSM 6562 TaxID=1121431 RepID=A0A5S4ZRD1_9FIRM|nr:ABC transporter substrate-binding protein [Desulfallas thermosapovorans]TYO95289.1 peptide/nickel transport system substrate-binding protein [Desulfallas thermosapovorans DSM 6562]